MRDLLKRLIVWKLGLLARLVLWRYRPKIVAVTGSVGKTTTKDLVGEVLANHYRTRTAKGSYNSEFGVPLTIIDETVGAGIRDWLGIIWRAWGLVLRKEDYPEVLVLEMSADHPGDIAYLTRLAPPDIAVVTNVRGVHLENYDSIDQITAEKAKIIENLKPDGVAILNFDDMPSRMMRTIAPAGVIFYGLTEEANVWVSDIAHSPHGVSATLNVAEVQDTSPQTWLLKTQLLGRHQMHAVAAAVAVGLALDIPVDDTLATVADFQPPPGRGRLLHGRQGLLIIDDSYNASPQAMIDALTTLKAMPGPHWAVLGHMGELGDASDDSHRMVGEFLSPWLDRLITVGRPARLIGDAAIGAGMPKDQVVFAETVEEAAKSVDPNHQGGTVLVKASQVVYLERVVEALLTDPRDRALLVDRLKDPWHRKKVSLHA